MKKPPAKVASSKRRFDCRHHEDTRRNKGHKAESDDRLERELPYHNPSVPDTWEEVEDFVTKANFHIQHGGPTP